MENREKIEEQFSCEWNKLSGTNMEHGDFREDQDIIFTDWLMQYEERFSEWHNLDVPPAVESQNATRRNNKYHISDLVDISLIHKLLYECHAITGVTNALLDNDNNILSAVGWLDICTKFHRVCPHTEKRCRESDSFIFSHIEDRCIFYKCLNGLADYAVPIIVEGQKLAAVYVGQFLYEPPDIEIFRQQAKECGFDEAAYMEALEQVPIISEDRLQNIMNFYSQLVQVIATMGLERIRQLDAAEDKFAKAFHCSPDPITITTLEEGSYVEMNDAWVENTGYERHEAIGRTGIEMGIWFSPEERDLMLERINESGRIRSLETRYRAKSGEVGTYLVSADILDINGIPHMLCVHKDITDRKRMESELRLSEECFAKAFNGSPIIMFITTFDEDERFIDVNDCFCQVIGFSREEMLGKTSLQAGFCLDPNDRFLVFSMINKKQAVRDMEIHFVTKNGETRLGLYSAERIDIAGQDCILSLLIDITERKQMEIEMKRLDRLNLVGEMAASIGHEIRNPMTTVRGFLQMLQGKENYWDDHETLELMIDELDRANAIITEFLSLAKHKLVKLEISDLNRIIKTMLPLFQVHAISQDKVVELELGHIPRMLLDEKEIRQMLLNLVRNGLEAMLPGGILTIKTAMQGEYIMLSIEDQGEGILPELLEKMGTPFFSTKEHGTGLGLAVCYGIAERHNASIDIETGLQGTTFNVRFNRRSGL